MMGNNQKFALDCNTNDFDRKIQAPMFGQKKLQ